jgi:hypothetical protein
VSHPDDRFEREAESAASSFGHASPASPAPAGSVQREAHDEEEPAAQAMPLQRQEEEEPEEEPAAQTMPMQRQEEEEPEGETA